MTSLKLKLFVRLRRGAEPDGSAGNFAVSKERQKSSMSQKTVTISRQNSDRDGFGDQTVDLIYHIPQEFCFLLRRTHVIPNCNRRTRALLIGAQDQFALLVGVAVRARISRRAPPAVAAQITLAAVGGRAV